MPTLRVRQLVQRFCQWVARSRDDEATVHAAMAATDITDLADRHIDVLSGGQRQRVWIAMVH